MNTVQPYKWGLELEYKRPAFTAGSVDRKESVAGYLVATQIDQKWERKQENNEIKKANMGNKEEIIFYDKNRILMIPKKFFVNNEKIYQGLFLINRFSQG